MLANKYLRSCFLAFLRFGSAKELAELENRVGSPRLFLSCLQFPLYVTNNQSKILLFGFLGHQTSYQRTLPSAEATDCR